MSSWKRRKVARLVLGIMFFAQAAYALAGCESSGRGAASALAEARYTCHQPETPVNLCLNHCLADDQSLDKHTVAVPVALDAPVLIVGMAHQPRVRVAMVRERPRPAAGPPPRILLHSFLI